MGASILDESIGGMRGGFGFGGGDNGMGVLLGLLLARGGLGGYGENNRRDDCVTQSDLNGKAIGDLKAEIKDVQAGIQLGLCEAESSINATTMAATNQLQNGQTAILLQAANQTAAITAAIAAVDTNVDRTACETQNAIKDAASSIIAAFTSAQMAELNQKLTVAQLDGLELRQRNERDRERHTVEVTMINNQNQNVLQNQRTEFNINALVGCIQQLAGQVSKATNSNVIVGSTGVGTSQTANPTNVNAH